MLCIKVPVKQAEKMKKEILAKGLFDREHSIVKDKGFVYFPVNRKCKSENSKNKYNLVNKKLEKKELQTDLKTALKEKLGKKDLKNLRKAMDVIGNIAILEIPQELENTEKEKIIAKEVLRLNRNIKTVLRKGKHEGVFRVQKLKHLAGEKTKEANYRENNVIMKLDVEQVYFSPRLSTERKRIMQLVKKPEDILVMFSGCAPYLCVLAKNTIAKQVDGVEINPVAHDYALQNIVLNKLKNAEVFLGDVKDVVLKLNRKYDRIIMPLPKSAADYLDVALAASRKGTFIHFYDFQKEGEFENSVEKIKKACDSAGNKFKVLNIVKCGQNAPREFRICVDLEIL
jgi:tRNA (guanine37-N1)-methyltransferase